jgi:hypothetical protein
MDYGTTLQVLKTTAVVQEPKRADCSTIGRIETHVMVFQ